MTEIVDTMACGTSSALTGRTSRRRRSGNTPAAREARATLANAPTASADRLMRWDGTGRTAAARRTPSRRRSRMRGVSTTCTATSGSGARTCTGPATPAVWTEAAAGTAMPGTARRRFGAATSPTTATATSTSGWQPRWIEPMGQNRLRRVVR